MIFFGVFQKFQWKVYISFVKIKNGFHFFWHVVAAVFFSPLSSLLVSTAWCFSLILGFTKWWQKCLFIRLSVEKPETKAILVDNVLNIIHQLTLHFTLVVCESCQIKRTASRLTYAEVTALRKRYDLMINNHVTVYGFVRWVLLFFEAKVSSRTDTRWLPQIAFLNKWHIVTPLHHPFYGVSTTFFFICAWWTLFCVPFTKNFIPWKTSTEWTLCNLSFCRKGH